MSTTPRLEDLIIDIFVHLQNNQIEKTFELYQSAIAGYHLAGVDFPIYVRENIFRSALKTATNFLVDEEYSKSADICRFVFNNFSDYPRDTVNNLIENVYFGLKKSDSNQLSDFAPFYFESELISMDNVLSNQHTKGVRVRLSRLNEEAAGLGVELPEKYYKIMRRYYLTEMFLNIKFASNYLQRGNQKAALHCIEEVERIHENAKEVGLFALPLEYLNLRGKLSEHP